MNDIKRIAIDLAKHVFQVCALDKHKKILFNKKVNRKKLKQLMSNIPPSSVYMEACYSSHYWARELTQLGHTVYLIPAQHVKPFVRGNKNDANDALAIAECAERPNLRFVPIKTEQQQQILCVHRIRQRLVRQRIQLTNQLRGLLTDFGLIARQGNTGFKQMMAHIEEHELLTDEFRLIVLSIRDEFNAITEHITALESFLDKHREENKNCQIVQSIPGIGPLTASALVAMIDKGQAFAKPSDLAVWVGLTPKLHESGTHSRMGNITKRGDKYLRYILVQGANTAITWAKKRDDAYSLWIKQLARRLGRKKAAVAIAHKMIKLAWVLLQKQEMFQLKSAN